MPRLERWEVLADWMLSDWAGWRYGFEIYKGTGNSACSRMLEPSSRTYGSRELWRGRAERYYSRIDSHLSGALKPVAIGMLVVLYGTTGEEWRKAGQLGVSSRTLRRLKKKARRTVKPLLKR
ncbi:hypothetical protein CI610_00322 [invertebrate metagenome]|uniref:Uncharacterized protein n=1 Tax=invertebrate metagenome TaxID=1711999 RepID=A0A2H9TBN8_9ZZZZ